MNVDEYKKFIGAKTPLYSRIWGKMIIESASFTPASDGDLVVYFGEHETSVERPVVRIHSECVFAEVFDSDFCDCADQLYYAMDYLRQTNGILFYLRFDGRGAGLSAKVKATELEMQGIDTYTSRLMIGVPPEGRDFSPIADYLLSHGINKITLLTNSPDKYGDLANKGIDVNTLPLYVNTPNENVQKLYDTKVKKFKHRIPLNELEIK